MSGQNITEKKNKESNEKSERMLEDQALQTNSGKQHLSETETDRAETVRPATPRHKRIAALLGVILLGALYLITLIAAIFDKSSSGRWFLLCLIGTVVIPLLIWIYTWMYGVLTGRRTIASVEPKNRRESETGRPEDKVRETGDSDTTALETAEPDTGKSQK